MTSNTARTALRTATAAYHDRVDTAFSKANLADRVSYGHFLQAQAAAHLPVEDALARAGVAAIVIDWDARRRSASLRDDLATLGLDVPAPAGELMLDDEAAVLGALYVLEGSRLGGALLKRSVSPYLPTQFLGGMNSTAWRDLLMLLDERLDTEAKRAIAIAAACDVFILFETSGHRHLG